VYQVIGGYEDANDSNSLRYELIYKIAGDRLPIANEELLASQPTITRLENQSGKMADLLERARLQFVQTQAGYSC
jgi:Transposase DDE domain group 1